MSSATIVRQIKQQAGRNEYAWKPGARVGVKPDVAMAAFRAIYDANGGITPADVVAHAVSTASPFHGEFEWDDPIAADAFRADQARYLLRSLVVVVRRADGTATDPVRAVVSVAPDDDGGEDENPTAFAPRTFIPVSAAMGEEEQRRRQVLAAFRELQHWRRRYRSIEAFARVFEAIDAAEIQVGA